jgi:glyoxylase I family protein
MAAITHIAFFCKNLKAQEAFYTKHFGFRRARVFNAGTPNEFFLLRLGDTRLELFSAPPGNENTMAGPQAVGFHHLALEVADMEKLVAGLEADGIQTEGINQHSTMKICFFHDPEGNRIELMQGYEDEL